MQVAVNLLKEHGATVAELASPLGYRSEAAFARAFKRVMGVPPGAVKRKPPKPGASESAANAGFSAT